MRVEAIGGATSLADRKTRAGQRLLLPVVGLAVDQDLREVVRLVQPAGFVLTAENAAEPPQVRDLIEELASLVDPHDPALVAADYPPEGPLPAGGSLVWPAPEAILRHSGASARAGGFVARSLRAVGFNVSLALPWAWGEALPDVIDAHLEAHVLPAVGPLPSDHPAAEGVQGLAAPVVRYGAVPAEAVRPSLALLEAGPTAGLSASGGVAATRAGIDVMVAGAAPDEVLRLFEALVHAQERDPGMDRASLEAVGRVRRLRERYFVDLPAAPPLSVVDAPEHRAAIVAWREQR